MQEIGKMQKIQESEARVNSLKYAKLTTFGIKKT